MVEKRTMDNWGMHFNDRTFCIFRNGWIDCGDSFYVLFSVMILCNGLKMNEYET